MTGTDTTQTTPRPDQDDVVGEPDFYLNLADARIVATEALLEASENIADTIEARAMSCIYGDAGLGKTFSVLTALKEISAERVLLLQFRSRPTPPVTSARNCSPNSASKANPRPTPASSTACSSEP
ncbi:hypothetical protein [Streptomyces collinus]|uniref:hypothetical protein n=1 Tax=Streptomyces collinus TaxID=42684 RepID=UPI0003F6A131